MVSASFRNGMLRNLRSKLNQNIQGGMEDDFVQTAENKRTHVLATNNALQVCH
jgi:hypothetical protein